jgi:uncharacterized membrane protein YphA (DoxX/SURF4 family)
MRFSPEYWDSSTRLLYGIVLLRVAVGGTFVWQGYQHWDDPLLTENLSSQWVDWTHNNPLFVIQDLYRWVVIPNAGLFAKVQMLHELTAGVLVSLGLFHQIGIAMVLVWVAVQLLLVAHLQVPYLNATLLGLMLMCVVLWLADAGRWGGLDSRRPLTTPSSPRVNTFLNDGDIMA